MGCGAFAVGVALSALAVPQLVIANPGLPETDAAKQPQREAASVPTSKPTPAIVLAPDETPTPPPSIRDKLVGFYLNPNYALDNKLDFSRDSSWTKTGRVFGNLGLILLGFVSAIAWHEFSHFVVAKIAGTEFEWPVGGFDGPLLPRWKIPPSASARARAWIAGSGFLTHALTTETLMWIPQVPKDNLFIVSFLMTMILNNMFYPLTDAIFNASTGRGYGDLQIMRDAGVSRSGVTAIQIVLIVHGAWSLTRLFFLDKRFKSRFNPWAPIRGAGTDVVLLRW